MPGLRHGRVTASLPRATMGPTVSGELGGIVLVLRVAAGAWAAVSLVACTPENPPSGTRPHAPPTSLISTPGEAPPTPAIIVTTEPASSAATRRGLQPAPSRPHTIETLDIPQVELPPPHPICTDSDGQPVMCSQAGGPIAPLPNAPTPTVTSPGTPTAPPATTEAPSPMEPGDDSEERGSESLRSSASNETNP